MKACKHKRVFMYMARRVTRVPNRLKGRMLTAACAACAAPMPVTWPLGSYAANDKGVKNEIRAAALYAGYETGNDLDDVLDDPITRNVLEQMTGLQDLRSAAAREVFELHEVIRETEG